MFHVGFNPTFIEMCWELIAESLHSCKEAHFQCSMQQPLETFCWKGHMLFYGCAGVPIRFLNNFTRKTILVDRHFLHSNVLDQHQSSNNHLELHENVFNYSPGLGQKIHKWSGTPLELEIITGYERYSFLQHTAEEIFIAQI